VAGRIGRMEACDLAAVAFDPTRIFKALGYAADEWQQKLLFSTDQHILLNCCRQSGKSTATAALAIYEAIFKPRSLTLLLCPSQRQSSEIFRKVLDAYNALGRPIQAVYETQLKMELVNGSRIVCLPGREETVRSFSGVNLLIIDEASRVPDDLYYSVRPMLAVSKGRLVALSTPFGPRGWFWREYTGKNDWRRFCITYQDCPRITPEFIEHELKSMGPLWIDQEYSCLFTAMEGLVYPDFGQCIIDIEPVIPEWARFLGGIDFGWRNPFAAIWGHYDPSEDILYITRERYARQTLLHDHIKALRKFPRVKWYADPAGADQLNECRAANMQIIKGFNDIRLGVAAVTARIRTGRLKVLRTTCFNLIDEAQLHRYPSESERHILGENPIDNDNHALSALRYLISRLDFRFIAKLRRKAPDRPPDEIPAVEGRSYYDLQGIPSDADMANRDESRRALGRKTEWLDPRNEQLWTSRN
jgi:hypothetical protein